MPLTALTGAVLTTNGRGKLLINRGYRILGTVNAKVNGRSTVNRALTATDSHRSLADNADLGDSQRVNAVNGSCREIGVRVALDPSDPGPIPDCLLRAPKVARPPALGPLGDSLDDLQ